jgi:prolipoprotein diacylglyceryltransferase
MFPTINLGPLSLPAPEFILLLGFWLGSTLSERHAKRFNLDPLVLDKVLWITLLSGIIGARLSYVVRSSFAFEGNLLAIISLNPDLLDPAGGIFISTAVGFLFLSKQQISAKAFLDSISPFLGVMAIALSLSNFASGRGFGTSTVLPWGIDLWGEIRHPVQIYYIIGGFLTLLFLLSIFRIKIYLPGTIFTAFLSLTSGYRLFFSGFQETRFVTFYGIRISQVVVWAILLISLYFLRNQIFPVREEKTHAS